MITTLEAVGAAAICLVGLSVVYAILEFLLAMIPAVVTLEGKAVVVTGCDTGIGRVIALHLAMQRKAKVFAGCLTEEGSEELSVESKGKISTFIVDVTSDRSVSVALDFVARHLEGRPLFAVINNAGVGRGFLVEATGMDDYYSNINVNFLGLVRVTKAFLPMLVVGKGRIVNITSSATLLAGPTMSPYAASKYAAAAFSDSMRRELHCQGVKVVQIAPGIINTRMPIAAQQQMKELFHNMDAEVQERYGGTKWVDRLVQQNIRGLKAMSKAEIVLPSVLAALMSRYPKARYICGIDSYLLWRPLSLMPVCVTDAVLNWMIM
eukprot:evm.model.scf_596.3 EVM.evm.TU.scf_596.3   scf_596:63374-64339(+)